MSVEYYLFLEEIRMISDNIESLQKCLNEKVLDSFFFMEDLKNHIERIDHLLLR
ncbi:MAG: hypothetical protein ACFE9Z_13415 [Promethearchaeota archaeon]